MSAVPARRSNSSALRAAPSSAPSRSTRPVLRVLPPPAVSRTRAPFLLVCSGLLLAALLGALLLNTAMARGAYHAHDLEVRLARMAQTEQSLNEQLSQAASPAQLAQAAEKLGMVPAPRTAFIDLSRGAILGVPTPATDSTP